MSDLSDLEADSDEDQDELSPELISKPNGEAGKTNSGGYNLEKALGWEEKHFSEFTKYIKDEVANKLDVKKCFSKQKQADIDKIIQFAAQRFKIENKYINNWPIREALKARLKYTSDWEKKKESRKIEGELKRVLRPNTGIA